VLTQVDANKFQAEKDELNWLLTSGALGRSSNLARMLTFVCEKHFQNQDDQVTEYMLATEALGRRESFDPQTDTIVRVTAHSLRKRLQEIYQAEGVDRPVHVLIPLGRYVPSFVPSTENHALDLREAPQLASSWSQLALRRAHSTAVKLLPKQLSHWLVLSGVVAAVSLLCVAFLFSHRNTAKAVVVSSPDLPAALPPPNNTIRALLGTGRKTYVDHSGYTWTPGKYCSGAESVTVPPQKIIGTDDPYIYWGGIRGIAYCTFPVKPGQYEVHFYFAETSDLQPVTRPALLSINTGADIHFDVVDSAGGDGIATSFVQTGIHPENDGNIHLEYTSATALLNAVEILPADSEKLLPVRIAAGPNSITDSANQLWLSDRYFIGGRRGQVPNSTNTPNRGIYSYDRIGTFRYNIPVASPGSYRVRLFFYEPWFGQHNLVNGGPGSRIFDVSCNGNMILKNFDIMAEGGTSPVVKTFDNIQATAEGRIELSFMKVVNYPEVNAIEIVAEPSH
jgi:hypothetical protein